MTIIRYKPVRGLNDTSLNKLIEISGVDLADKKYVDEKFSSLEKNTEIIQNSLTSLKTDINEKIKQIVLHAEDFRENSTMTDDELINNIILNTSNKDVTVLFEKSKNYVFNDYIKIKRSNLTLDFNNSDITLNMNNPDIRKGLFYMYSDSMTYNITDFNLYYNYDKPAYKLLIYLQLYFLLLL